MIGQNNERMHYSRGVLSISSPFALGRKQK